MEESAVEKPVRNVSPARTAHVHQATEAETHIKDTIESILVAFILAFIFRAFVVEAFVIPTGSMAPTLLGAHMRMTCADCGYTFDLNYSSEKTDSNDVTIESEYKGQIADLYCPNCGYPIPHAKPGDPGFVPPVRYGDRILVLKYAYLLHAPERWDVVVFKAPAEPQTFDYTQNYIKRLVGRPNESIMILDGDVYAGARLAEPRDMHIQTKPRAVQEAMLRLVHDNDYLPRGLGRNPDPEKNPTVAPWTQPWTPVPGQSGWDVSGKGAASAAGAGRRLRFDNANGSADLVFSADANAETHALTDWIIYDHSARDRWENKHVSDLKLKLAYRRESGDGPLRLALTKYGRTFVAEITRTSARLVEVLDKGETEIIGPQSFSGGDAELALEFQNVDYCLALRVNGRELFRTTPEQYGPQIDKLLGGLEGKPSDAGVKISADRQTCELRHVSLWRDVYYLNSTPQISPKNFWGNPKNVMRLGPDEYFVLGDNSLISGDARYWGDNTAIDLPAENLAAEAGRVPGRFLLGKAFFVYWPAGYRPFNNAPALVPNFGDMRFIN